MQKKYLPVIIVVLILVLTAGITTIYYFRNANENSNINSGNNSNATVNNNSSQNDGASLDLPTEGNDTVLTIKSNTTLRVINEYDKKFFTSNKNLLIMFGSWCPNCQEEIAEIEKILNYYKDNNNVNIVLIAHEFEGTVTDLIDLLENDVNFGSAEVKIDLGRVIRKQLDPEASTIPISYVVDKNGNVLDKHDDSLTLQKAIEMVGK